MAETSNRKELQAEWKTEVNVPSMTAKDVAKHNTKSDLWIIIHGKVYDVTKYARDHPGGPDALIEVAGADATSAYEDVGHSEDAREIMHKFLVGVTDDGDAPKTPAKPTVQLVQRGADKKAAPQSKGFPVWGQFASVGAVSVTLVGVMWTNLPHHLHLPGGFTAGFLWASVAGAVVAYSGYSKLDKAMQFGGDYTRFPAHKHTAETVTSVGRPAGVLKPQEYQKLPLIRKDALSKDTFRLVFQLPSSTSVLGLPCGQHVAIRGFFDDDSGHHTITRSYTPVSNNRDLGRLELVIKMYADGQMTGKYLQHIQVGDKVEFRGPKGAMKYRKGVAKNIGMVAGGTGITPMYQLIRAICEDKTDDTQIHLIYANRSPDDILLRNQLEHMEKLGPQKLHIHYVVDKAVPGWKGGVGFVDKQMIQEKLPPADKNTKVMLCGPPGMINATKKNLVQLGFEEPGSVSKMTDQIFLF